MGTVLKLLSRIYVRSHVSWPRHKYANEQSQANAYLTEHGVPSDMHLPEDAHCHTSLRRIWMVHIL